MTEQAIDIKISPESVQGIVERAILESLSKDERDTLIAQAIKALLTPRKDVTGWSKQEITPIQGAFDLAVREVALKVVREELDKEDSELALSVRKTVGETIVAMASANPYDGLAETIGQAVGAAVGQWIQDRNRSNY